ncbi:hypothetical protein RM51_17465 [Chryseobacterium taiwanense]|uniref:Uncharacterized protein n=1 Tax=Chryseobacterium taiwanense TaxID=363331 RepID=A0A0B4DAP9_9FLAO|nr:hypothetical protein RM51_17465 [Chryseobacterium taiwanense]
MKLLVPAREAKLPAPELFLYVIANKAKQSQNIPKHLFKTFTCRILTCHSFPSIGGVAKIQRIFDGVVLNRIK